MSRYLSVEEVIEINAEVVRKFGGIHGLRDRGGLQSAVAVRRTDTTRTRLKKLQRYLKAFPRTIHF